MGLISASAIAALAEWAGHTAWERGGTAAHWKGKPPKEAITALEAYKLYLQSHPADDTALLVADDSNGKEPAADAAAQVRAVTDSIACKGSRDATL